MMAGIASLLPCDTVLTGDECVRRRPMQPLIEALNELGVRCESTRGNGLAPLIVRGPNHGRAHAHTRRRQLPVHLLTADLLGAQGGGHRPFA